MPPVIRLQRTAHFYSTAKGPIKESVHPKNIFVLIYSCLCCSRSKQFCLIQNSKEDLRNVYIVVRRIQLTIMIYFSIKTAKCFLVMPGYSDREHSLNIEVNFYIV